MSLRGGEEEKCTMMNKKKSHNHNKIVLKTNNRKPTDRVDSSEGKTRKQLEPHQIES